MCYEGKVCAFIGHLGDSEQILIFLVILKRCISSSRFLCDWCLLARSHWSKKQLSSLLVTMKSWACNTPNLWVTILVQAIAQVVCLQTFTSQADSRHSDWWRFANKCRLIYEYLQHAAINQSQHKPPVTHLCSADLEHLVLQLNPCPAAAMSLYVERFLFPICEAAAGLWM